MFTGWSSQSQPIMLNYLVCSAPRSVSVIYTQGGSKSKLLTLREYINNTEKIGGTWTKTNSYRESEAVFDIFTWNILLQYSFMFKYSM